MVDGVPTLDVLWQRGFESGLYVQGKQDREGGGCDWENARRR